MANEGLLKFDWHVTGLATITAIILKSDDSTRQSGIIMSDSGHLGRYVNTTSIPIIVPGDSVKIFIGAVVAGAKEFREETRAVALRTTIDTVISPDISFTLTTGPAVASILFNAVVMITDISSGLSIPRRISAYSATKQVTLDTDAGFALSSGDEVTVWGDSYEGELGEVAVDEIADAVVAKLKIPFQWEGT